MKYTSAEPITLKPGESKAMRFVDDDGAEHVFIVSVPGRTMSDGSYVTIGGIASVSIITVDGAVDAPVRVCHHLRLDES